MSQSHAPIGFPVGGVPRGTVSPPAPQRPATPAQPVTTEPVNGHTITPVTPDTTNTTTPIYPASPEPPVTEAPESAESSSETTEPAGPETSSPPVNDPPVSPTKLVPTTHDGRPALPRGRAKAKKSRPTAPPGVPIPWWWTPKGLWYHIVLRLIGQLDKVPEIGKRQRLRWETQQAEAEIRFWSANIEQMTATVVNPVGGSGKSLTSARLGELNAEVTKRPTLVMPVTEAPDNSATGSYTGIPPEDAMNITRFYNLCGKLDDDTLRQLIPTTSTGLMVITEDPTGAIAVGDGGITSAMSIPATQTAKRIAQVCIFDSGNDTVKGNSIVLEAVRDADVVIYVGTPSKPLSLKKFSTIIAKYMTDLRTPDNVDLKPGTHRSGRQIPTAEKAANGLAVFTGVDPNEGPEDYAKWTYNQSESGQPTSVGFVGTVLTVPFLQRFKRLEKKKGKKGGDHLDIVIKPKHLTRAERLADLRVLRAAYRTTAVNQGLRIQFDPADPTNTTPIAKSLRLSDEEIVKRYGKLTQQPNPSSTNV